MIYIRESLIRPGANLLEIKQHDDILWVKFDENNSYFLHTVYLCLCYNVPSGSSRRGMIEDDVFDRLTLHIEQLKSDSDEQCSFIICGDFNARSGTSNDYVADDAARHVHALPEDYETDFPIARSSQDTVLNENGNLLINFCRQTGLRMLMVVLGRMPRSVRVRTWGAEVQISLTMFL